jgi:quercetin dioxygenase-like cupin family protein
MKVQFPLCVVLAGCLAVIPFVQHAATQQRGPLTVTRLYTGPDGQTHAEEIALKLMPRQGAELQDQSEVFKAASGRFVRAAPGFFEDWHHPERRQYLITLSGHGEIEVAGGQKVQLLPGRILLVEDVTGKGHRTRTIGSESRVSVNIPLDGQ